MGNTRIYKYLSAIFTPDFNIGNSLKIANTISSIFKELLDDVNWNPSILPIPQDAPPEIPRLILSSTDDRWTVNISPERTSLFYNNPPELDNVSIEIKRYSDIASHFLSEFQNQMDLRVQRIAFVTERCIYKDNALGYILENFCDDNKIHKGQPFHNAKIFEVHSLKKYDWMEFQINSWVRIKCMPFKINATDSSPAIIVINDLNTLSYEEDPAASFISTDINKYYNNITKHLDDILELYFHGEL